MHAVLRTEKKNHLLKRGLLGGGSKMAQQVKLSTAKLDYLTSIHFTHRLEGESLFLSPDLHMCVLGHTHASAPFFKYIK